MICIMYLLCERRFFHNPKILVYFSFLPEGHGQVVFDLKKNQNVAKKDNLEVLSKSRVLKLTFLA